MIISNPTENAITVQIKGVEYTLPAKGKLDVPEFVASYWKNNLHNFLKLGDEPAEVEAPKVSETKVEKKEDVVPPAEPVVPAAEPKETPKSAPKVTNPKK